MYARYYKTFYFEYATFERKKLELSDIKYPDSS